MLVFVAIGCWSFSGRYMSPEAAGPLGVKSPVQLGVKSAASWRGVPHGTCCKFCGAATVTTGAGSVCEIAARLLLLLLLRICMHDVASAVVFRLTRPRWTYRSTVITRPAPSQQYWTFVSRSPRPRH